MKNFRLIALVLIPIIFLLLQTNHLPSQWIQTNLNSPSVKSLAASGDTVFAGTTSDGIFKSVDGGKNWFSVSNGLGNSFPIDALLIKDNIIYAGTDGGGVYKSTNGGSNWYQVNSGMTILFVHALVENGNEIYAVGDRDVYRSTNGAESWTLILQMIQNFYCLAVNGNSIFVGASTAGVFRTTNGGTNWSAVNNGLPVGGVFALTVSNGEIFAGKYGGISGGVYRSTNNGQSWALCFSDYYVTHLKSIGTDIYVAGYEKCIFRTTNNGSTWIDWNHGPLSITPLCIANSENYLYAGGYFYVWKRSKLPTLNLKINLEAYSPNSDTVTVYLRQSSAPYSLADSGKGFLTSSGNLWCNFENAVNGVNYYIIVKHRNCLETWSKSGGESFTTELLAYDFTSSQSQAFGNNLTLTGDKYSIYSGDVDSDGFVDGSDVLLISNDAAVFLNGYVTTDLTGDGFVDATDLVYADNNSFSFVGLIRP